VVVDETNRAKHETESGGLGGLVGEKWDGGIYEPE
jgi:hypothetical protein